MTSSRESSGAATILIVDDEDGIRRALEAVLRDEGFTVLLAPTGELALERVEAGGIDLVLLDIWLPGLDGIEVLKRIKEIAAMVPVVMMSGHATIATAIAATRLGANDFIEKPLDLDQTMLTIRRALGGREGAAALAAGSLALDNADDADLTLGRADVLAAIDPIVFRTQALRGRAIQQRTLARSAVRYGQGLHSGRKSGLLLEPLPPNSGIHFVGVSETTPVPAHVEYVGSTGYATTVRLGKTQAGTIEHVMSALHAYGISNLLIKCNGEVPVLDGSASEFCRLIREVGVEEQPGDWYAIQVPRIIRVDSGREWIQIEPADKFSIHYTLDYPVPVGKQAMTFTLNSPWVGDRFDTAAYEKEIAPARTFGFVKDIGALQRQGLALGGRFDNFVLFGEKGAINDQLRFENEPVRHKILDAIGDLYLLGRPLAGKVTAHMTGHSDNIALLREIREELVRAG